MMISIGVSLRIIADMSNISSLFQSSSKNAAHKSVFVSTI